MSTDNPLFAGYVPPPARGPTPGRVVWTMVKNGRTAQAEIRDQGVAGAELQVFVGDQFVNGRLYHSTVEATEAAARRRLQMIDRGWSDPA